MADERGAFDRALDEEIIDLLFGGNGTGGPTGEPRGIPVGERYHVMTNDEIEELLDRD